MQSSGRHRSDRVLLFDLGKVVFDLSMERAFERWAARSGGSARALMDAFSTVAEHDAFERGGITPAAFRDAVRTRLHLDIPDDELDAGWCSIYLDVYPGMEELLTELGHTRRLAAFTNTNLIHEPVWRKRYAGILRHFEPIFCSHLIGARKPEPEAYGYVLAQLGVEAHNVTFLDDNLANVTAARACGIDAIHVSSQAAMLEELHARGLR